MKKFTMYCLLGVLQVFAAALSSFAQSTANYTFSTGTDASLLSDRNGNAIDMTSGAASLLVAGDDDTRSPAVPFPFDFWFMGQGYPGVTVTDNAIIRLGGAAGAAQYAFPINTQPIVSAFANDLRIGSDGYVRGKSVGTAPNRCYVIEWRNVMIRYGTTAPGTGTFQVRFYETSGIIEFVYGTMATNGSLPTDYFVGFSNNTVVNTVLSVNTNTHTVSTAASPTANSYTSNSTITSLSSSSDGVRRRYTFIPPGTSGSSVSTVINAPTGLNFSAVGISGFTVNWTPPAVTTGIVGYAIYVSTDGGASYTLNKTVAGAATASTALTGLSAGTTYMIRVNAFSEGVLSAGITGSQMAGPCAAAFSTPTPSGSPLTYTVPAGVTSVQIVMAGGSGGASTAGNAGGNGGAVTATLAVTPSSAINVYVGGAGADGVAGSTSNGGVGGATGGTGGNGSNGSGGGGGGTSEIRIGGTAPANRVLVAAGGGGGGSNGGNVNTGGAGGASGGNGSGSAAGARQGKGATTTVPGAGGTTAAGVTTVGGAGTATAGGAGGAGGNQGGGGGGAGVLGGGGGVGGSNAVTAAGGGGANFVAASGTSGVTNTTATTTGNGYVYISIASTPTVYAMTGGGTACASPGVSTGLANSQSGIVYQLQRDGVNVGSPVISTGGPIDFGFQTVSGTYTSYAYYQGYSSCATPMTGSAVVNITSPAVQTVTSNNNGVYCAGSAGAVISLSNSQSTATYTLGRSGTVVQTLTGVNGTLNFSPVTTAGTYTVSASNISAPECPVLMSGTVTVSPVPLPDIQTVTGGGPYCGGSSGSVVSLANSQTGVTYSLGSAGFIAATASGTGGAINFAPTTVIGTFTVSAAYNSPLPACPVQMANSVSISAIPAPSFNGLTTTQTLCAGDNAIFNYTGVNNGGDKYKIVWSPSGIITDVTTFTNLPGTGTGFVVPVSAAAAGTTFTGTLTLQNSVTGCVSNSILTLNVNVGPSAITILPNNSTAVCFGSGVATVATATLPIGGTLIGQNFDAGMTGQAGGLWTIENIAGNASSVWQIRPSPGYSSSFVDPGPGDGSSYVQLASDALNGVTTTILHAPVFSTVGLTAVNISYNQRYINLDDEAYLQYSLDGVSWTTLLDQSAAGDDDNLTWTAGTPQVSVALPPAALSQPEVHLRWYYNGDWAYIWSIDNVVVTGITPPITYTWSGIAGASGLSCTNCSSVTITPAVAGTNIYSVTAAYGGCTTTSGISVFATNTTPATPVFGTVSSTCNSIALNWLGGSGATDFQLTVSTDPTMSGGFVFGPAFVGNVLNKTITGLDGNTTYYYRLRGSNSCFGFGPATGIQSIATLPTPAVTVGNNPICATATSIFTGSPAGGTWSSSAPSVATVTAGPSATATVSGVSAGSSVISYNANGCTATGTINVTSAVFPPAFAITPSSATICAGGQQQLTVPPVPLASPTNVYTYTGSPVFIPDADDAGATASINVSGIPVSATILDVQVTLISLTHTFVGDLGISLKAPNGSVLNLINHRGGSGENFINTVISSLGTTQVPNGAANAPFTGTYKASLATGSGTGPTSQLANVTTWDALYSIMNGNWTIGMADDASGDDGVLSQWSITIHYSVPGSYTWTGTSLYNDQALSSPYIAGTQTNTVYASPSGTEVYTATAVYAGLTCLTKNTSTITAQPLPTLQTVTGTGTGCASTGVAVGLANSQTGVSYQLYRGATAIGDPVAGNTGSSISFGAQTTAGTYTVLGTYSSGLGCPRVMDGSAVVTIVANPVAQTMTGGGAGCADVGVELGLSNSQTGVNYTLYRGSTATGIVVAGTDGNPVSFGFQTTAGTYTVSASNSTSPACPTDMPGSKVVTINPLPNVTGLSAAATSPCIGGASTVTLTSANLVNGTTYTVNYTLSGASGNNATANASMTFGAGTGSFTIVAGNLGNSGATTVTVNSITENTTTCASSVSGVNAGFTVKTVPGLIAGSNTICFGAGTATASLTNSAVLGTWSSSNIAVATINTNTGVTTSTGQGVTIITYDNGCAPAATMSMTVNATPAATIGGANTLCFGAGASTTTATNTSTNGTWSSSNVGVATVNTTTGDVTSAGQGITTISYDNGCGAAATKSLTVNATPAAIAGNTQLCEGGAGITLTNTSTNGTWSSNNASVATIDMMSGVVTQGMQGTALISYDNGCGSAAVATATVNAAPQPIGGNAQLCAGGSTITLTNTSTNGTWSGGSTAVATVDAMTGIVTSNAQGTTTFMYSNGCGTATMITATVNNAPAAITGNVPTCTFGLTATLANASTNGTWSSSDPAIASIDAMTGVVTTGSVSGFPVITYDNGCGTAAQATFTVLSGPAVQTFTGGGGYCTGGTGVSIGLTLSETGVNYQLFQGSGAVSPIVPGTTGSPITFGSSYLAAGYYYAVATNAASGCMSTLPGVTVHINPLPDVFNVTGGGSYCSSGGAGVLVGLDSSIVGIDYQLYDASATLVATTSGTGAPISFGLVPAGIYTAKAVNTATGCDIAMNGSATVDFYPSPTVHNVLGGGTYCLGGSGVNVSLDGSDLGIDYQLIYGGFIPLGGAVDGTGTGLDMGDHFLPGDYTVVARDTTTGCTDTMAGDAQINFALPPNFYFVGGGGGFCAGDAGVNITLSGSQTDVSYQLFLAGSPVGSPMTGTGSALDFGLFTTPGNYTVVATNNSTGCTSNMLFSATVSVNPVVIPTVSLNTGVGTDNRVCYGNPITFTAVTTNGGATPTYEWKINNITVPAGDTYTYTPVDGDIVWVRMTSSTACAIPSQAMDTMYVDVDTTAVPSVFLTVDPITSVPTGTTVTFTAHVTNGGPAPTFQWYKNGTLIAGANTSIYSTNNLANRDSIMVMVTSSGGCGGVVTYNGVRVTVYGVGVADVSPKIADVRLVPNPNKGTFSVTGTLSTTEDADVDLEIVNMLGQSVYKGRVKAKNGEINTQVQLNNSLANGMYMLNLQSGEDHKVFHFVLEQ